MVDTEHVVVVGAGFGGLTLARRLARRSQDRQLRVTLVDRHNYHTFQPLLYQVATSGLQPQDIGHSVRGVFGLRRARRSPQPAVPVGASGHASGGEPVDFRMGTVIAVDADQRRVHLADGGVLAFDHLVLAAGAVSNDFGIPGVEEHGFALKSLAHATTLRNHILGCFERAGADVTEIVPSELTFVVAGAGPTGVELAGALAELRDVLRRDHPAAAVDAARIVLIEMKDRVLPGYHPDSGAYARRELEARGVEVRLSTRIEEVRADRVVLAADERHPDGFALETLSLMWTAGVKANPLAEAVGANQTGGGRIEVGVDLALPGHRDVFAVGDIAGATDRDGQLLPQLAPVAIQQGAHVADQIVRDIDGRARTPFHYRDKGIMATVGRNAAVAELPLGIRLTGFVAWLAWLLLHLIELVGTRNRVAVFLSWVWSYVTYDRASRLIIDQTESDEAGELRQVQAGGGQGR